MLKGTGSYLFATFSLPKLVQIWWLSMTSRQNVHMGILTEQTEDLVFLRALIEARKIRVAIDRCFPLAQTAEAHRYVESGHKQGHVVITVAQQDRI